MPEPASSRGNAVTPAPFEAPFQTQPFVFGTGGLNLVSAADKLGPGEYTRCTNVTWLPEEPFAVTSRPGQTPLVSVGTRHHSAARMDDPEVPDTTRFWGVDGNLYRGLNGAPVQIDFGYSGDPLTLLPHRPPLSGDPWLFIADRNRMRKARFDGLVLPIGLPAPASPVGLSLGAEGRTDIASFTGATASTAWTGTPGVYTGTDPDGNPITSPTAPPQAIAPSTFRFVSAQAIARDATSAYVFWGLPITLNLDLVGGVAAADEDLMHLNMALSHPWYIQEVRLYVVVSPTFTAGLVPGTVTSSGPVNADFYMKSFRAGDFSPFLLGTNPQAEIAEISRVREIRQRALRQLSEETGAAAARTRQVIRSTTEWLQQIDPYRKQSLTAGASAQEVVEFGIVGNPVRRGDFERFGSTAGRDWSTVTGLVILLRVEPFISDVVGGVDVTLTDWYLTGGSGPDSTEPGAQSYDVRYTHYDTRTGAEGNPSPVLADDQFLDAARRTIIATPVAMGDTGIRQRFYRRGGSLTDDWYFEGENAFDGAAFPCTETDLALAAAGTVHLDHFQPVPTVDDAGNTVLAQPVRNLFGPVNGQLFACGDPHRPGHVYACIPDEPDHWPPDLVAEVCAPSEELLAGLVYGGQPYVFSRERLYALYPNLTGAAGLTSTPTQCTRGPAGPWAWAVGAGAIWFVADGLYRTTGGPEQRVSGKVQPLFEGRSVNGYQPVNFTVPADLRVVVFRDEVWVSYRDLAGGLQQLIYQVVSGTWRHYSFSQPITGLAIDLGNPTPTLLLGGATSGASYTFTGATDNGITAIPATLRTGVQDFGVAREDKLLGDQFLDADLAGGTVTIQNFLNAEAVANPAVPVTAPAGRGRAIFDSFYSAAFPNGPQKAANLSTEFTWAETAPPTLYQFGTSISRQPETTINRVTPWDDLGHPDEAYLMGVTLDADTGGLPRTIHIERDWAGAVTTVATLTITHVGRHKLKYSWPALPANQVRIRPDDDCGPWQLYRADWIAQPEPPRISKWDIHFENAWDQYLTGLDLYCDTAGLTKVIVVEVDGVPVVDPATGDPFYPVSTSGRGVVHLTLPTVPPLRGHVLRFYATDDNQGLLYDHRWHTAPEPSEQHNWNQPFTILGTQADKYLKAVIYEVDTFGQDKTVRIEADGVEVATQVVNTSGRKVVQLALPQVLGRVWRILPVDGHPSRLYSLRPVFDEEPFALDRWETQETDHDLGGFQTLVQAQVTLKSTSDVLLTITTHINQIGTTQTDQYTIPATGGDKQMRFVPFVARKGVLFKYVFSAAAPFWLYQEESHVLIQPWSGGDPVRVRPWGNDDADRTRAMVNATLAAQTSGGGSQ